MDGWINVWMDGWLSEWLCGWVDGGRDGWIGGRVAGELDGVGVVGLMGGWMDEIFREGLIDSFKATGEDELGGWGQMDGWTDGCLEGLCQRDAMGHGLVNGVQGRVRYPLSTSLCWGWLHGLQAGPGAL